MAGFHDDMREARAVLHDYMSRPALCFFDPAELNPRQVTVRVHEKWMALGDLKGTNFNYAEIEDVTPRIIFWRSMIEPVDKMFVSIARGIAFQIDTVQPPDDVTITAFASRVPLAKCRNFRLPVTL